MLDELYMRDLANAMKMPEEVLPVGKVTVSGPQIEKAPKQPEMGTITGIPQTAFEKALETSGVKLSELGDMIDESAPGTLNTLLGKEIPIIGNLKLRDFLPFVGSKEGNKLTGTPAALIAAGTGQPLRGQPVVGSAIGPDGQRYYGTSGSPAMLSEDVGTAVIDVATLGLGKPLATLAKKAVKATKGLPVGLSIQNVGQGVDELGFYSAAKQAVDAIQQPKGTGDQFLKQIEKTPGVKPDEIKWTGLDEFLQSKKTVTKAEVQEYLDKNRVQIKEVKLGEPDEGEIQALLNDEIGQGMTRQDAIDYLANDEGSLAPKFSKYTLPGGENYREILLTLPTKMVSKDEARVILGAKPDAKLSQADIQFASRKQADEFKSSHFEQPNILAHLRVNDRIDADGKKVLFVEEVQSDWHQAGRQKGYQTGDPAKEMNDYESNLPTRAREAMKNNALKDGLSEREADQLSTSIVRNTDFDGMVKYLDETDKYKELFNKVINKNKSVPDAPFKTTWSDLSMKRVIQMASEDGYERIAFTTGKTQAERYDLSKQIDSIEYFPESQSFVALKNGSPVISENASPEKLADYIGKDAASKLLEQPKVKAKRIGQTVMQQISGQDLQVGGEGMIKFYDDILPKFLNKYSKKWDAKTSKMNMFISPREGSVQVNYMDITPKMRESVMTKGQPMFAIGAGGAGAAATQEENK